MDLNFEFNFELQSSGPCNCFGGEWRSAHIKIVQWKSWHSCWSALCSLRHKKESYYMVASSHFIPLELVGFNIISLFWIFRGTSRSHAPISTTMWFQIFHRASSVSEVWILCKQLNHKIKIFRIHDFYIFTYKFNWLNL